MKPYFVLFFCFFVLAIMNEFNFNFTVRREWESAKSLAHCWISPEFIITTSTLLILVWTHRAHSYQIWDGQLDPSPDIDQNPDKFSFSLFEFLAKSLSTTHKLTQKRNMIFRKLFNRWLSKTNQMQQHQKALAPKTWQQSILLNSTDLFLPDLLHYRQPILGEDYKSYWISL